MSWVAISLSKRQATQLMEMFAAINCEAKKAGKIPIGFNELINALFHKSLLPLGTPGALMSDEETNEYVQNLKADLRERYGQEDFAPDDFAGVNLAVLADAMKERFKEQTKMRPDMKPKVKTPIKNKRKKPLKKKQQG
jgi:hypothetical protein